MLDSRLTAVAKLVRRGRRLADIGTDHAYLPVYLIENGIIDTAVAADLRTGPLNNARATVENHGLSDKISLRLSDGLDSFSAGEADEIVVAGMGGLLISEFVKRTDWLKNSDIHLILQPMTHAEDLRKTLFDCGFTIDRECVAKDSGKLYIIISAYFCGKATAYDEFDLIIGRLAENEDELSVEYLNKMYNKYRQKFIALENAGKEVGNLKEITEELKKWRQ